MVLGVTFLYYFADADFSTDVLLSSSNVNRDTIPISRAGHSLPTGQKDINLVVTPPYSFSHPKENEARDLQQEPRDLQQDPIQRESDNTVFSSSQVPDMCDATADPKHLVSHYMYQSSATCMYVRMILLCRSLNILLFLL